MSDPRTRDEAIRDFARFSFPKSIEEARIIDEHLQSLPIGQLNYCWKGIKTGAVTYFTHNPSVKQNQK